MRSLNAGNNAPNSAREYSIRFSRVGSAIDNISPVWEIGESVFTLVHVCKWPRELADYLRSDVVVRQRTRDEGKFLAPTCQRDVDAKAN